LNIALNELDDLTLHARPPFIATVDTNEEAAVDINEEAAVDTNEEAAIDTNEESAAK
jgi:hypothetical protein